MRRLCGWCSKFMGFAEPLSDQQITTGVCRDCEEQWMRQIQLSQMPNAERIVRHA